MPLLTPKPKPEPPVASPYRPHSRIAKFLHDFVCKPFEKHAVTRAWNREIVATEWPHQAGLVDNGRSGFTEAKSGLPPEDLVLIYCYRYMQMHVVSGLHTFYRNLKEHKLEILKNPLFIDFGCGPLTSGISLAWYNLVARTHKNPAEPDGLRVHYIGIDQSEPMLAHAQTASVAPGLFHSRATFDFVIPDKAPALLPAYIRKYRALNGNKELTVILNCSYFFGSRTLDVPALVTLVNTLLKKHLSEDKVCLVFQNANHSDVNVNWDAFKEGVKTLLPSFSSKPEEIQYYDTTGRRTQRNPQTIKLRREVLLNNMWKELLEKPKEKK